MGNVVLARVVRLMPKQAIVVIQQVGATVLQTEWQGVIRVQDVRATEKDKVKMYESFKPGDVVRAQVVSGPDLKPLVRQSWCGSELTRWPSDFTGRPGQLLSFDGLERAGRHHGHKRGWQRHGPGQLEGIQGP